MTKLLNATTGPVVVGDEDGDTVVYSGENTAEARRQARIATSISAYVALVDGATITPNLAGASNFSVTLGGNRALANPTGASSGQSGTIVIKQDATGGRSLTYGTNWRFPSGAALGGVLSSAPNATDLLSYIVQADGTIFATVNKAFAA